MGLLIVFLLCAIIFTILLRVDQKIDPRESLPSRAIGSMATASVAIAVAILVTLTTLLDIPGRKGPVQYFPEGTLGKVVFDVRAATMFFVMFVPLIGIFRSIRQPDFQRPTDGGWMFFSILLYIAAWFLIIVFEFFPTA